jgi:cobyrinic acid a,c-diamide synthase
MADLIHNIDSRVSATITGTPVHNIDAYVVKPKLVQITMQMQDKIPLSMKI